MAAPSRAHRATGFARVPRDSRAAEQRPWQGERERSKRDHGGVPEVATARRVLVGEPVFPQEQARRVPARGALVRPDKLLGR